MSKQYETVIGLEVHVELATKTKIFCACSTAFGGAPNTHTCPVCTGMPGSLPVLNKQVVEYALAVGLATNCQIHQYCKFDRKNYFYPDNPQNYQISQLYLPICHDGGVEIETAGGKKIIGIHEIHMEEDAGKLVHDEWEDCSLVDYNRSGVPLIEIVSEPDMRSAEEVIAYLEKLRQIIQYLGASDCKLQEGSMRADVNLSVREVGAEKFGTRTEMKNLNSFKAIAHAIEGERERQIELIEAGRKVIQETRRWDDNKESSFTMRSKEDAKDYRYYPEPDLVQLVISEVSREYGQNATGMGGLVAAQHVAAVVLPVVLGALADRIGKKPVLCIFAAVFAAGCFLAGLSKNLGVYVIGAVCVGAGYSVCESVSSAVLSELDAKKGARYINLSQALLSLGAVISPFLVQWLQKSRHASWRLPFLICAAAYTLLALLLLLTVFPKRQIVTQREATARTDFFASRAFRLLFFSILLYVGLENGISYFAESLSKMFAKPEQPQLPTPEKKDSGTPQGV